MCNFIHYYLDKCVYIHAESERELQETSHVKSYANKQNKAYRHE